MANQHFAGETNLRVGDNVIPTTNYIGDFVTGTDTATTPLIANTNTYTIAPSIWETSYKDEIILSSRKNNRVVLKPNKKNFLIIKSSNLFVCWNEELSHWDIFKLESFEEDFGEYVKPKTKLIDGTKSTSSTYVINSATNNLSVISIASSNASVIKAIAELEGNFYVDMEDKKVYEFSCEDEIWKRRGYGKFSIKTSRAAKVGELKKKRQNNKSALLLEKYPKKDLVYVPNWSLKNRNYGQGTVGNLFYDGNAGDFVVYGNDNINLLNIDAYGTVGIANTEPNQTITVNTSATNGTFQIQTDGTINIT